MGSFFTNVQVFAGERSIAEVREAVIMALRHRASEAGLEEDDTLEDPSCVRASYAERVIMVAQAGSEPWIAVYDEVTEDQDPDDLRELGEALSRIGQAAVTVLVHDSDILVMGLWQGGAQVDLYNSYPNYYREDPDEPRAPSTGQASLWSAVLAPGETPETLQAAWERHDVFAEDTVRRIAGLLGWSPRKCARGFRWLSQVADDLTGYTRLAFRPTTQTAEGRAPVFAEGPPRFDQGGGQTEITGTTGSRFEGFGATFRSVGGTGQGFRVVIWGPALELGLVELQAIRLVWKPGAASQHERREITLEAGQSADGASLRHARIEDVPIPAGISEAALGNPSSADAAARPDLESHGAALMQALRATGLTMHRLMDLMAATNIGVGLVGEAIRAGSSQLHLGITPLEHSAGETSWTFEVTIRDA